MNEILRRRAEQSARRMADAPGGGMIKPSFKDYDFQKLTSEEEAEIAEAWRRNEADPC
ncbi:MAG: hypothetical protein AB7J13_16475 [Pyrinomonadaceae bacterium]